MSNNNLRKTTVPPPTGTKGRENPPPVNTLSRNPKGTSSQNK